MRWQFFCLACNYNFAAHRRHGSGRGGVLEEDKAEHKMHVKKEKKITDIKRMIRIRRTS
jgi:hypothetical protein